MADSDDEVANQEVVNRDSLQANQEVANRAGLQVDSVLKADAAMRAGAVGVLLQVPQGLPPPDPGLQSSVSLSIPVVFADVDDCAQLDGSTACIEVQ